MKKSTIAIITTSVILTFSIGAFVGGSFVNYINDYEASVTTQHAVIRTVEDNIVTFVTDDGNEWEFFTYAPITEHEATVTFAGEEVIDFEPIECTLTDCPIEHMPH